MPLVYGLDQSLRGVGMIKALLMAGIMVGATAVVVEAQQQRIDVYDKYSRRQGYVIVNERQGRVDFYDKYSRLTGYATIENRRPGPQPPSVGTTTSRLLPRR